ncbi:MAG: L-lactate permease [Firmicutes bacterium]|nr:L-lactate permease [Bacillota bacterium]
MFDFLISLAPIAVMLVTLLIMKMPAKKASAITFTVAMIEFILIYKPGVTGAIITIEKGLAMGLFVGFIAIGAMLLYNLVDMAGGFNTINGFLSTLFKDRFALFILICWTFTAFLQGIAGYGLPAVIATTILLKAGYDPAKSAAAALLGHSWAISFGSMGSSIYAIDLVTDAPSHEILVWMSNVGSLGLLACGMGVCFIYGGFSHVIKGLKYIVPTWLVMSASLMLMAKLDMVSVIGFVTGLTGVIAMMIVYRVISKEKYDHFDKKQVKDLLNGVLPYILIVVMSIGFFILSPKLKFSFSFPGYETLLGVVVPAEEDYVTFNILKYPFTIILLTTLISLVYYDRIGSLKLNSFGTIVKKTWKKIYSTEITLFLLLCTANIMMDSGMIVTLSTSIVAFTGGLYPIMAAVVGAIGAFITGSNTNSNILFGALQENAAISLGMTPAIMCAAQSIAASIGGAIGPTTTALSATAAGKTGHESEVYHYTLLPTLAAVAAIGIMNIIIL